MGKKILKRSLVMSALMALVITGNVWAGEPESTVSDKVFTFGNKQDASGLELKGAWGEPVSTSNGPMYYPDPSLTVSGNSLIAVNDLDFTENGLLFAGGFSAILDSENVDALPSVDISKNTISIKGENGKKQINIKGYIELVAGYYSKRAYGTGMNNEVKIENAIIRSLNSAICINGVFANQAGKIIDREHGKDVTAKENKVLISDSTIQAGGFSKKIELYGADVFVGDVSNNEVNLENSTFKDGSVQIAGGAVETLGDAIDNTVSIVNVNLGVESKNDEIYGGRTKSGLAKINDLNISNSNLKNESLYGGYSGDGSVEGNTVNIFDVVVEESIIYSGYTANGDAKNNIVSITNANLQGSSLYGGYSDKGIISGNTLNVGKNITGKLNTIGGFNTINFENIAWEKGGNVIGTDELKLREDTEVFIKKISSTSKVDGYMDLILVGNEFDGTVANEGEQTVEVNTAEVVTGNLTKEDKSIRFTILDKELNPQVTALADANVVANAFVASGTGLVEDSIDAMMCEERIGYKTFAQVHGSNLDFDTNNNLSVQGWSGIVGVGETTEDRLTYGIFFETGDGDYNTFAKQSEGYVRGDGEVDYNGGGVLVRKDYENGIYTEASLRAGRMNNEVHDAVVDSSNKLNGFDISSTYYGAHIGVGKIIPRGEKESLDIYGKFLYSHHDGESFVIDGDTFNMDSVNSQRLRVGFRYNELNGSKLRMYYGAAYEYEFDGAANNTVLDYNFSAPDLGGSTIVGELGLHYNADAKWCFDLNVRGYAGQREGFTGSVQANYLF